MLVCFSVGYVHAKATSIATHSTTEAPVSFIDDPLEAATTSDSGEPVEEICFRCYDRVRFAQALIDTQLSLTSKIKKIIQRKTKPTTEETQRSFSSNNIRPRRTQKKSSTNSTVRTLLNNQSDHIIVSRLRVARAAGSKPTSSNNKKDPDLKQLRQEQEQQLNLTCQSIISLQECLTELLHECIADLQYHSVEVYANQWHGKLNCPYKNNPNRKPFKNLIPKSWQDTTKEPAARPISSPEAVRGRLHQMFPNLDARSFGVMLEPRLTSVATQRFDSMNAQQQREQSQQQGDPSKGHQIPSRVFSGHNEVRRQGDSINLVNVSKVLLVPCCFAIMVALITIAKLFYKHPVEEEEDEKK